MRRLLALAIALLTGSGLVVVGIRRSEPSSQVTARDLGRYAGSPAITSASPTGPVAGGPARAPAPPTTVAPPPEILPRPTAAVALAGCPPPPRPPRPPRPPSPPAWRPSVLVPEAQLPPAPDPAPWTAPLGPALGKGMWLWKYKLTEKGDAAAIVDRAQAAGLRQLWVRVGDSRDGFYGADVLTQLVARAHSRGIAVIGWGFPYLYDPVADARWSSEAIAWRGAGGDRLDGFSPDLETSTEGVVLTDRRAAVYLSQVRAAAADRPVIATVYRPVDRLWLGSYPYRTIARYVDAFAPMVYWGCTEPGDAVTEAMARLSALRPVHAIGQAYNMADEGGRTLAPTAAETWRFLDVAERGGAIGASFWVWQDMSPDEWRALASFRWRP